MSQDSSNADSTPARLVTEGGEITELTSPCQVGRAEGCTLTLFDTQVSRNHCLIQQDSNGKWWLTDQESTNGTYLNFKRVSQAVILRNGDRLGIGDTTFFFQNDEEKPEPEEKEPEASNTPEVGGTMINFTQVKCWLLVGDIIGSTELSQEASPQALNQLIGEWGSECKNVIDANGGDVNKFLGDGFFAFWRSAGTEPASVRTAVETLESMRSSHELDFRLILHLGDVQMGGVMTKGEENLSGPAVNYTFKAEKVASTLGEKIFISEEAAKAMGTEGLELIGSYSVPGFPDERAFFRLGS